MGSPVWPDLDASFVLEPCRANTPLPSETVTLIMFTDMEGSRSLWAEDSTRTSQALAVHDALARSAVESRHGSVVTTTGDGIHGAFDDALAATVDLQQVFDASHH